MRQLASILAVLLSHWRRHPGHCATLLLGLAMATALWSGVQAINEQARSSYQRVAAIFGSDRLQMLVSRKGLTFPQDLYLDLRLAGWRVSPVLEGRVRIGQMSLRLLGVDPMTLPTEVDLGAAQDEDAELVAFLTPPWRTLVAPETLEELGLPEGATAATAQGHTLPPLTVRAGLAPGILVADMGVAQDVLEAPGRASRLLMSPNADAAAPPLSAVAGDQLRLTERDEQADLSQLTESFHLNLTAFGFLAFVVGLFIVHASIGLAFEQRLPMMRTLRACGVSARALTCTLVAELLALALIAGTLGMICGYLIATMLLPDVATSLQGLYGAHVPGLLALEYDWWFAGLGMTILGAMAAAAGSLARAYRLPLLAPAHPYAWQAAHRRWLRRQAMVAIVAFAVAVAAFLFGRSLSVAFVMTGGLLMGAALALPPMLNGILQRGESGAHHPLVKWFWADSRQQLSGLSLALMALLLALSVNVGIGTMVEGFRQTFAVWLDQRLIADVYLKANDEVQGQALERWLEQRPEVEVVLPSWSVEARFGGWPTDVYGIRDHPVYRDHWPLLNAAPDVWDRLHASDAALVSEQLARRLNIGLGDTLHIPTEQGEWPVEVVGLYADYGNPRGQVRIGLDALLAHWPDVQRTDFSLRLAPGTLPELIESVGEALGLGDGQIIDQASLKRLSTQMFERTFAVTAALKALTLGVAGIALLTSLLTLSNMRLPQLAPLWALGVTRSRLALIELLKLSALAAMTAFFALPLGVVLAWCLVAVVHVQAFGWRLPLHLFPSQWLQLIGLALVTALFAAAVPMIRLARMSPARLAKVFADER